MTIRLIAVTIAMSALQLIHGQNSQSNQETAFVEVYMGSKQSKNDGQETVDSLLEVYKIDHSDYKQILKRSLTGDHQKLTPTQSHFIDELQIQEAKLALEKERDLEVLCDENNISLAEYKIILDKYRTNIKYQRSLKPYFEAYINSKR